MESDKDTAIEHQQVPIEHRSLHDFLYSSTDEHGVAEATIAIENGGAIEPWQSWCDRAANAKIAGVYAVLNAQQQTQYVGYSRNVLLSLNGHLAQNGAETCAFVRVQPFKFPKRTEMEQLRDAWIEALASVPPGNAEANECWAGTIGEVAKAAMSEVERHAYEEKKLKLRKAMADGQLSRELDLQPAADERQQKLAAAVENDDWSSVIQTQTQETV
ncbi:MAG TPA: GIY-YIG nuclease family protein [Coleofasciculaceae cyanobacterium]|jgi:hypothetical protein